MRIHLLSDLHHEVGVAYQPAVRDADVTILAGDIDVKGRGVTWAKETFPGRVLYVPGNHEFYRGHLQRTLGKMAAAADDRVMVLDRQAVIIDGVRFLGATGWTDFTATGNPPLATWDALQHMADYRKIRHTPSFRRWHPKAAQTEALLTLAWLREELQQPFEGRTVVITHHAPSLESIKGHPDAGTHLDASYVNQWDALFGPTLALWLHGHTHYPVDYTRNGTRVVSNPRGYPGEHLAGFNPELVIEV